MSKDDRLYGKFTLDFADNPKILPLSDSAFRCMVEATLYSRRMMTDGFLATRLAVAKWGLEALQELATNDPLKPSLFEVDGGWMIRDFADHQDTRAEIEARRARNAANGSLGGKARAKRLASDSLSETQAETETETETETKTKTTTSNEVVKNTSSNVELQLFESAWAHWPKKVERADAYKRFRTACKKIPVEQLSAAIIRFGDAYADTTERQFTPALGALLNGERWTDELPSRPVGKMTRGEENMQVVARYAQMAQMEAIGS